MSGKSDRAAPFLSSNVDPEWQASISFNMCSAIPIPKQDARVLERFPVMRSVGTLHIGGSPAWVRRAYVDPLTVESA